MAKLKDVVADMNHHGYVLPVLSQRLEVGGTVRLRQNIPRTKRILATELLQSIVDDCNIHRMPTFAHIPKNAGTFITHHYVVKNLGHRKGLKRADVLVCRNPYVWRNIASGEADWHHHVFAHSLFCW